MLEGLWPNLRRLKASVAPPAALSPYDHSPPDGQMGVPVRGGDCGPSGAGPDTRLPAWGAAGEELAPICPCPADLEGLGTGLAGPSWSGPGVSTWRLWGGQSPPRPAGQGSPHRSQTRELCHQDGGRSPCCSHGQHLGTPGPAGPAWWVGPGQYLSRQASSPATRPMAVVGLRFPPRSRCCQEALRVLVQEAAGGRSHRRPGTPMRRATPWGPASCLAQRAGRGRSFLLPWPALLCTGPSTAGQVGSFWCGALASLCHLSCPLVSRGYWAPAEGHPGHRAWEAPSLCSLQGPEPAP